MRIGTSAGATTGPPQEVILPRRPVLTFWLIAVALEVLLGVAFLLSGAESAIDDGLSKAGIDFGSDLLTAGRVLVVYPAALLGVALALAQVAAPDLAVLVVARIRGGLGLLRAVGRRFRPWSREVGARKGLGIWLAVVVVFSACNVASGLLHKAFVPTSLAVDHLCGQVFPDEILGVVEGQHRSIRLGPSRSSEEVTRVQLSTVLAGKIDSG